MFKGVDVDWFAFNNLNAVLHFASAGGLVPYFVDEHISELATKVLSLPIVSPEVIINEDLSNFVSLPDQKSFDLYVESFLNFARRGLFSYDKSILNNYESPLYYLVAAPSKALDRKELSDSLLSLIPQTILPINPLIHQQVNIEIYTK
ncbi:hypothetical protein IC235_17000 [Hymenobacter sp. BT664]|uniref:Uncharacterized protein n=1 Tax=Hymenobacter montanus TaxID=2771359 RepID=A0A927BGF2_9BACT|nr:hypothetical protein [Hymenobacter montanus]MBD2769589.1 hypothetical protein [Hymenobacter montanus]